MAVVEEPIGAGQSGHEATRRHRLLALRVGLGLTAAGVVWVLWPYWGWLVLAAWFGAFARPALHRLDRLCGGRRGAAAVATLLLFVVIVAPIVLIVASLTADAMTLIASLSTAPSGKAALRGLVTTAPAVGSPHLDMRTVQQFLQDHADRAVELVSGVAGSVLGVLLGLIVFFTGAYVFLVNGPKVIVWVEEIAPASTTNVRRLRDAFLETGRGLLIGSGLTGLVQAVIGTIAYLALGVPRPFVLGLLTFVSSVIPGVGTALVWVPVTAGLALTGQTTAAVIMGIIGAVLISGADNVVRPLFVRWGKLDLPPFAVMVSVFGGLAVAGPWGILLGPLVLRLALEMLRIARDERVV